MDEEESVFDVICNMLSFSLDVIFMIVLITFNLVRVVITFYLLMILINYLPIIIIVSFFVPSFGLTIFQTIGALWTKT